MRWRCSVAERPRFAIIPTNGRECVKQALEAMSPQVDRIVLTWNGFVPEEINSWEMYAWSDYPHNVAIVFSPQRRDRNVSRWWNQGLEHVADWASTGGVSKWDVAIINDDVIIPPGWFDAVSSKMREMKCAAACSGGRSPMPWFINHVGPIPGVANPLQGFAFMVAGELGLRANEDIPWYFSDNFMDWESRKLGGTVVIPGFHVDHLYPNGQMTGELQEASAKGAQVFRDFYGVMPW